MAVVGAIALSAQRQIPETWAALAIASTYGEDNLRAAVDLVKWKLFGVVVPPENEGDIYDPLVLDYAGKLVAISIIPAAVEYWMQARTSETVAGERNETTTYVDRAAKLWEVHKYLVDQTRTMLPEIRVILGTNLKLRSTDAKIGYREPANVDFLTPNPFEFPRKESIPVTDDV